MEHGVVFVSFDLPMDTPIQRKDYRGFVKNLKRSGYLMIQESLYVKPIQNQRLFEGNIQEVEACLPRSGNVKVLYISERQYKEIRCVLGDSLPKLSLEKNILF